MPKGWRYDKKSLILAAELDNISPAACKIFCKSGSIALPSTKVMKEMLSKCSQDTNLKTLFDKLTVEHKSNKVKLIQEMRFTSGHVLGHVQNMSNGLEL